MNQPDRIAPARISSQIASFATIARSGIALLAVLCVGVGAAPAPAQTLRMGWGSPSPGGGPPPSAPHRPLFRPAPPTVVSTPPGVVYQPRFFYRVPSKHDNAPSPHVPHHPKPFPYAPIYVPGSYVAPSDGQWVPGHWAYIWVPQDQATSVWVPGYYDRDGVWVAGYFTAPVTQSGYYQPYWVSGFWAP